MRRTLAERISLACHFENPSPRRMAAVPQIRIEPGAFGTSPRLGLGATHFAEGTRGAWRRAFAASVHIPRWTECGRGSSEDVPGIEARFRELVRYSKSQSGYTPSVGDALGIEGAEQSGPDMSTFKPVLTLRFEGGQVIVGWGWQGQAKFLDLIEIHVNRGNGYVLLAYDTTPNYTDTTPPPAAGQKWTYKPSTGSATSAWASGATRRASRWRHSTLVECAAPRAFPPR